MTAAMIKLCLLTIMFIPLLITNLRTGAVKNGMLGAILALGVLVALFGPTFGAGPFKLSALVGWILAAAVIGLRTGKNVLLVPPMMLAALVVGLMPVVAFNPF